MPLETYPTCLQAKISVAAIRQRGNVLVNTKDGSILTRVPAGVVEMGDGEDRDAPKHKVDLSEYWIGVNCVTNRQYEVFVKATNHWKPETANYGTPIWKNGTYPADKAEHPVVCVSWDDAEAYTKWAGCALPTEAQWEKAAKGPPGLNYPWGKDWKTDLCRNSENKGSEQTAPVCGYPKGASGYGTYQQSGNVWEWCRDWYDADYYGKSPAKDPGGPASGSARVGRGGSWLYSVAGYVRAGFRRGFDPGARYDNQSFRLVRAV